MTINKKIIGGYAIVLMILALVAGIGFYAVNRIQTGYDQFVDTRQRLVGYSDELRFETLRQITHYRGLLLYPDQLDRYGNELRSDHRRFLEAIDKIRGVAATAQELDMLKEIVALHAQHEQALARATELVQRGRSAEALAFSFRDVRPLTDSILDKVNRFRERQVELQAEGRAQLAAAVNVLRLAMAILSLLGFAIGVAIAIYLIRTITGQLRESITHLSSSAAEILATTTQVASGAAETATAVSETTATVEEVKQTAQVASQKARYVSDSAQKVAQVSQSGRKAVEDAIAGMNRVQEQMESIAESIVRLSEQSQVIGEIIATVNDLAEQSNLLAVNAAIEANKAGEQGKGFVIVAQEVKSLAEQSKQATAQVRAILGDIQRATSAAVLSTEQGNKAVQAGVKQTAETGESIRVLDDSITEAAQAATQIAASSQQQMVGMDQVALAMENIKQARMQNVAGTRQAEVAAQGVHELGQKLQQLAAQYKV